MQPFLSNIYIDSKGGNIYLICIAYITYITLIIKKHYTKSLFIYAGLVALIALIINFLTNISFT